MRQAVEHAVAQRQHAVALGLGVPAGDQLVALLGVLVADVVVLGGVAAGVEQVPVVVSKSALPAIRSRSAWVSWLTWFVTTFQPSTYMARLPQHS